MADRPPHGSGPLRADGTVRPRLEGGEDGLHGDVRIGGGLELPSWCLQGWCLTCASKLLDGEIDQGEARRYCDENRESDFILPCSVRPRADCRILVEQ